jgi:chromosomal replication initiator protein
VVDHLTEIFLPGQVPAGWVAPANRRHAHGRTPGAVPAFVAGPENRLVAATLGRLLEAANASNAIQFAPLVLSLFGPSGTGKTHLASGLVRYWQQHRGTEAAEYVTASDFRRQYIAAIRADAVARFRSRLRDRQLLAIDDLHQLPRDEHLIEELRYTLDAYDESGGTVVVTSNRPASTLANLAPALQSRLAAGLMLQLAPPGTDARVRIIRHATAALGHSLSDEAAHRLAASVTGTANDLIGALFEFFAAPTDPAAADRRRADGVLAARRPTLREIVAVVARYTSVPQKQLRSSSRRQSTVFARSLAVFLARELAQASYHAIGRGLGGRDHTTIMHNYRKIDADRIRSPATQEALNELRRILLSR